MLDSRDATRGVSTSSTMLEITTADCGMVYVDKVLSPMPVKSCEQMAAEINARVGERVVLVFPPFQLPAEGDLQMGYGYKLET